MTVVFNSARLSPEEWNRQNQETIELMKKIGAVIPDDFYSNGVPQISLVDHTLEKGQEFDFAPFEGCIAFGEGSGLNSAGVSPFPHGPVRLTVVRWGREESQCGRIIVGRKTGLSATSVVSWVGVTIGDGVLFGPGVVIMDTDGHSVDRTLPDVPANKIMEPVTIEDHAWLGLEAIIMRGVTVGHHAVVAARSVVVRDVPPHCVVLGNPARFVMDYGKDAAAGAKGESRPPGRTRRQ